MRARHEQDRRSFLRQAGAATLAARLASGAEKPVLAENNKGHYRFLRGIAPYSSGAVAMEGYQVVHVTLVPPPPYQAGFSALDRHLKRELRPSQALCGIELRSPRPFTFEGFQRFNQAYLEQLRSRGILMGELNPVARTNVAPELDPPPEVALYGFSYAASGAAPVSTFVVAGAGELRGDRLDAGEIVRRGDVSPDGLREKAEQVLRWMDQRIEGLGASWPQVTAVEVYTVHNIFPLVRSLLLPRLGPAKIHGLRWHFARPPIQELEFEMDVRGCARELVLRT